MSNKPFKFIIGFFILVGIIMLVILINGIWKDDVINLTWVTNWKYLKKLSDVSGVILIPWNVVGVFLLYLTLNIQQKQFKDTDFAIKQQQFETTFFNMLGVLIDIKKSIKFDIRSNTIVGKTEKTGQEFLEFVLAEIKQSYNEHLTLLGDQSNIVLILNKVKGNEIITPLERDIIRDDLNEIYLPIYQKYQGSLANYFRYVFNLIKFARKKRLTYKDDKDYIDLIQAQLTNDELSLIFYNAYSRNALNSKREYNFHSWLDDYSFFENIDASSLIKREHHLLYPKTVFKFLNTDERLLKK